MDHLNVLDFTKQEPLSERQARWAETLSPYDFKIAHLPGKDATVPNALSQRQQDIPYKADDGRLRGRRVLLETVKEGNQSQGWLHLQWRRGQSGDATAEQDESIDSHFNEPALQNLWKDGLKQNNRSRLIRTAVPSQWGLPVMLSECPIDDPLRLRWREQIWLPYHEPMRTRFMQMAAEPK